TLVLALSLTGKVRQAHAEHVEMVSWYWHFVDAVWVVVFTVVYVIGPEVLATANAAPVWRGGTHCLCTRSGGKNWSGTSGAEERGEEPWYLSSSTTPCRT